MFTTSADSHQGEQWHGSKVVRKDFSLRCYFENIKEPALEYVLSLFKRDTYGDLIFGERPWVVYSARVVKPCEVTKYPQLNGRLSGILVLNLAAFHPFGLSNINSAEDLDADAIKQGISPFLPLALMPTLPVVSASNRLTGTKEYLLYNAGTAPADTIISIAGNVGEGVVIENLESGDTCRVVKITDAVTTNAGKYLEMNSRTGECLMKSDSSVANGFIYHDGGFVKLSPNVHLLKDLPVTYTSSGVVTTTEPVFNSNHIASYAHVAGSWRRIGGVVDAKNAVVTPSPASSGSGTTQVAKMSKIRITPISTMSLSKFTVDYKHTFY